MDEKKPPAQPPKLSMDQLLKDPKLKPAPKPEKPRQRGRRGGGFFGSGMSAEDILGYTPGDRD